MANKHFLDRPDAIVFSWANNGNRWRRYVALMYIAFVMLLMATPMIATFYFLIVAQQSEGMAFFTDANLWAAIGLLPVVLWVRKLVIA